jgi:hypothetical protein
MKMSDYSIWVLAAAAAVMASPAHAQQAEAPEASSDAVAAPTAATDVLSDSELGELRGGESMIITNQTLVAITSGNVINGGYVAGNISLSDFALSNFNGLGNMLINSGAQVSLQTGMNVTINVGE